MFCFALAGAGDVAVAAWALLAGVPLAFVARAAFAAVPATMLISTTGVEPPPFLTLWASFSWAASDGWLESVFDDPPATMSTWCPPWRPSLPSSDEVVDGGASRCDEAAAVVSCRPDEESSLVRRDGWSAGRKLDGRSAAPASACGVALNEVGVRDPVVSLDSELLHSPLPAAVLVDCVCARCR